MTDAIRHRGPDGEGFYADHVAALGHRRLAIIDRAGGDQPIGNENGTCWIVFNGEIYNHRGLRERLVALGHRFRTRSDTETILHAYEEFGPNCVDLLEGMFAFAIYDQAHRDLFIARDRLGKKPLFYAVFQDVLHFASEIKSLQQSPLWDGAIDLEQLEGYLSLGYFIAPSTIYRHVKKLEPGHWLRLRRASDVAAFAARQAAILDALWQALRPGGKLLYVTCSVFPQENDAVVDAFVARLGGGGVRLALPDGAAAQWLPQAEHDGFFYALIQRQA
jgi:asparagine synthase (glutamine-hydrolysing)